MKTKAWTSELMYQLCCNNNVSVAFRSFGITNETTTILVALLDRYTKVLRVLPRVACLLSDNWLFCCQSDETRTAAVRSLVKGEQIELSELAARCDAAAVRAHYDVNDAELAVGDLESAVCNRVSLFGLKLITE
jgi:hypothetical protein